MKQIYKRIITIFTLIAVVVVFICIPVFLKKSQIDSRKKSDESSEMNNTTEAAFYVSG